MTREEEIAATILSQLGGNKFLAMTGCTNLARYKNSVSMKLRRNISKATHLKITLGSMDTYKVEFLKCRKEVTTVKEFNNVYCDMLEGIFQSVTGMNTRL